MLSTTLKPEESTKISGKEIKLVSLQETKAVISVDNEKFIFLIGQSREIKGMKITLTDIFYSGDDSLISFTTALTYTCGDKVCNADESQQICCEDCGCPTGEKCTGSGCLIPECLLDEDCKDSDKLTQDYCSEYKCKHKPIKCKSNSECDDSNLDTEDLCDNGKCKNIQNWVCKSDTDCQDSNPCTLDQCINKDCQSKIVPNCQDSQKKSQEQINNTQSEIIKASEKQGFIKRFINFIINIF